MDNIGYLNFHSAVCMPFCGSTDAHQKMCMLNFVQTKYMMLLNPAMSGLVFDKPQKVTGIDLKANSWGVSIHFETISVKVIRLVGIWHKHILVQPMPATEVAIVANPPLVTGSTQCPPPVQQQHTADTAWPPLPDGLPKDLCLLDCDTLLPAQQVATAQAPAQILPPPPPPPPTHTPLYRLVRRCYKGTMPSDEDVTGASFKWLSVPWGVPEYDCYTLPCFDDEIFTSKGLAACGVAPCFRGSAICMHEGNKPGQLLNRFKFTTGLLLGCAWLRTALWAELAKLQRTTPNWQLYCGIIVTDRSIARWPPCKGHNVASSAPIGSRCRRKLTACIYNVCSMALCT